jgi:hypothetical protein
LRDGECLVGWCFIDACALDGGLAEASDVAATAGNGTAIQAGDTAAAIKTAIPRMAQRVRVATPDPGCTPARQQPRW